MTIDSVEAARSFVRRCEGNEHLLTSEEVKYRDMCAALLAATAEVERLREALEQIACAEIDIGFFADHLIWSKGLARAALSPQPPKEEK